MRFAGASRCNMTPHNWGLISSSARLHPIRNEPSVCIFSLSLEQKTHVVVIVTILVKIGARIKVYVIGQGISNITINLKLGTLN